MDFLDELLKFLSALTVPLTVALFTKYILNRETPLPFAKRGVSGAYRHLCGEWYQYHITRNIHVSSHPFWVRDFWDMQIRGGRYMRGKLYFPSKPDEILYELLGEIRQGRLIITGRSERNPEDFFSVIFPDLTLQADKNDAIVGTMLAFDFQNNLYVAPMILSKQKDLEVDQLNQIVHTLEFPEKHLDNFLKGKAAKQLEPKVIKKDMPHKKKSGLRRFVFFGRSQRA